MSLARNRLGQQLEADARGASFRYFDTISALNLAQNSIKSLPTGIFTYLNNLENMNLSGNSLRSLDFEFSHMLMLRSFDVSNNLLTSLNDTVADKLSTVFLSKNVSGSKFMMDLTENPLVCSCDTLSFLKWLDAKQKHFVNFANYSCWFNNTYLRFARLRQDIVQPLSFQCSRRLAVIIASIFCGFGILLVAISICLYRYRWEARYFCLWLTHRSKLYREIVDDTVYEYDAFVVYAADDRNWVRQELMPNIEGDRRVNLSNNGEEPALRTPGDFGTFSLCVHELDFTPGDDIFENMWKMVDKSRKVSEILSSF